MRLFGAGTSRDYLRIQTEDSHRVEDGYGHDRSTGIGSVASPPAWSEQSRLSAISHEHDSCAEAAMHRIKPSCLETECVNLQQDSYGYVMLMVALCREGPPEGSKRKAAKTQVLNLVHALTVYGMSIFMELAVAGFLLKNSQGLAEGLDDESFQLRFNTTVAGATALLQQWSMATAAQHAQPGGQPPPLLLETCSKQLQVSMPQFYYIMISFWLMYMLAELKVASWEFIHLWGVEVRWNRADTLLVSGDGGKSTVIARLDGWMKALLMLLLPVVRGAVAAMVTFAGCKFLILQVEEAKIVMKVLCMKFAIQIDELMVRSLLTAGVRRELKQAKFWSDWGRPKESSLWDNGLGGLVYLLVVCILLLLTTEVVFRDLMFFRASCAEYCKHFPIPGAHQTKTLWDMTTDLL